MKLKEQLLIYKSGYFIYGLDLDVHQQINKEKAEGGAMEATVEELRGVAAKVVAAAKSFVDFASNQVGLQLYAIVKEQVNINDTKKNAAMVEENPEKLQQDLMNSMPRQSRTSPALRNSDNEEHLIRLFDEPLNATAPKKIFIRSRL